MDTPRINRRDFIQVTAAATGGLVVAFYMPWKETTALAAVGSDESFSPNAFLRVARDGSVTIIA